MVVKANVEFKDHFEEKTLRVDFNLVGNNKTTDAYLQQLIEEPHWGGRQGHLDHSLRLGDYLMVLKNKESKEVIYEEGFATLFEEWQSTAEAGKMSKSFDNSIILPYPKKEAILYIIKRTDLEFVDTLLNITIIPGGKEIVKNTPDTFKIDTIIQNKAPHQALDIVILAEGFRANEMNKFIDESHALAKTLFTSAIFAKNKERINIYAVQSISEESGSDKPKTKEWRNTYLNTSFSTLYSERYLMTKDICKVRSAASLVPYDQIYILVNTEKYGGGGIYNFYSICSAYGRANEQVLIHEFGHGLAALADEYYYDDNFLSDYIDLEREPWQKNITTLVNFDTKWADKIKENTKIPTPEAKSEQYPIGVYEGAAYSSKGIYRACVDCRMKTNTANDFCPICEEAIQEIIDLITSN